MRSNRLLIINRLIEGNVSGLAIPLGRELKLLRDQLLNQSLICDWRIALVGIIGFDY
jgi:hypothetical protein